MPSLPRRSTATSNAATRLAILLATLFAVMALPGAALAAPSGKIVTFQGYRLVVPVSWPVFRLAHASATCVRFNRHAVYLGRPSARQVCPTQPAGRTEAILVQPLAHAGQVLPATAAAGAVGSGAEGQLVNAAHHVLVTATWNHRPALIRRALRLASLSGAVRLAVQRRPHSAVAGAGARMRAYARSHLTSPATPAGPGQIYTGLGFDACNTPSSTTMADWATSPYSAIGIYIGGTNMACSQPNLSATWVSQESAAGWHMVPIYVGLQSPTNSCGCAGITPASAAIQGTQAAQDAVFDAQVIGMGAGNPLYFDMEAYSRTTANTTAVLAFLQAWTQQLHASGYLSGVYSSDASGIADLVSQQGTGYVEPDDLWMASWNNQQTTADSSVPPQYWAAHQRLHQYQGAHDETYGGARINIDGDYLDSATAAAGTGSGVALAPTVAPTPSLRVTAGPDGTTSLTPTWTNATGVAAWQLLGGSSPTSFTWAAPRIAAGAHLPVVTKNTFAYWEVQALGADGSVLGTSTPTATPAHVTIFGNSAFAPTRGLGAVPVGCLGISPCAVTARIFSGRSTFATTNREFIAAGGGLAYFKLSSAAQKALAHAHNHQLAVNVTVRSTTTGAHVTRKLTLSAFTTRNPSPARTGAQASQLKLIGTTEFVSHGWAGGILAACVGSAPCSATVTLMAGRTRLANTTSLQTIGAGELGYLSFTLTSAGHRLLTSNTSNQLGTTATITTPVAPSAIVPAPTGGGSGGGGVGGAAPSTTPTATTTTAKAHLALVRFP